MGATEPASRARRSHLRGVASPMPDSSAICTCVPCPRSYAATARSPRCVDRGLLVCRTVVGRLVRDPTRPFKPFERGYQSLGDPRLALVGGAGDLRPYSMHALRRGQRLHRCVSPGGRARARRRWSRPVRWGEQLVAAPVAAQVDVQHVHGRRTTGGVAGGRAPRPINPPAPCPRTRAAPRPWRGFRPDSRPGGRRCHPARCGCRPRGVTVRPDRRRPGRWPTGA